MPTDADDGHHADLTAPTAEPRAHPGVFKMLGESLPFGVASLVVVAVVYRLWNITWSIPLRPGSDSTLIQAMVKTIGTQGWYLHNPNLNAPFGQQFYDFPSGGESLQFVVFRIISWFTPNAGATMNVYYIGGFAALTIVTYLVVRSLRFPWVTSGLVAMLYTFLPYHFARSEYHLYRSTYLSAPIAVLLILWALSWRKVFLVAPDGPVWNLKRLWGNLRWPTLIVAIVLCGFVATFETMTIAFFLTVLVVVAILAAIRTKDWGHLAIAALFVVVCAGSFLIAMSPNLRFWSANGSNTVAARRYPTEQERYGLQPSQMLLPVPDHRIAALQGLQKDAREDSPIAGEPGQELGFIGAIGLLAVLGIVLTRGIPRRDEDRPLWDRSTLLRHAGLASMVAIVFGTVSGFALLLSINGFSQVRVWNRIVVLIALFALLAVGCAFEWIQQRGRTRWTRVGAIGLVGLITLAGLYDTAKPNPLGGGIANLPEVIAFAHQTDKVLPHSSMIFELPTIRFPESPPTHDALPYDELLPYVWSDPAKNLRWSAGGIKGRPDADWQQQIVSTDPVPSLAGLAGLGFDAVAVDLFAYKPADRARIAAELTGALGRPIVVSSEQRWQLWNLRGYAARNHLSPAKLHASAKKLVGDQVGNIQ